MKKRIFPLLICVVAASLLFCLVACSKLESDEPEPIAPPVEDTAFTVSLLLEGEPFSPPIPISAQWSGEDGKFSAEFDENGVARMEGLDGDYHVTLSAVPEGYTYDPNGYRATNANKKLDVEILKIIPTEGEGASSYDAIVVQSLGTYRTTLDGVEDVVFYQYYPTEEGHYSIESWVDTTANDVNPLLDVYIGTFAYNRFSHTQDDGGEKSTFTKNFRYDVQLSEDMIGNVWTFGVRADARGGKFPINIDFTIKYEGVYDPPATYYEHMDAAGPFVNLRPMGVARYNYADTGRVLDGDRFRLNPADGFYHLYDSEGEYQNDEDRYGAILFTYINVDFEVLQTDSHHGFCDPLVSLTFENRDYYDFIDEYVAYCNSDGGHPVTADLKEFLQLYALNQRLFFDGNGWAETTADLRSAEDDMWLFSCYYYAN